MTPQQVTENHKVTERVDFRGNVHTQYSIQIGKDSITAKSLEDLQIKASLYVVTSPDVVGVSNWINNKNRTIRL